MSPTVLQSNFSQEEQEDHMLSRCFSQEPLLFANDYFSTLIDKRVGMTE